MKKNYIAPMAKVIDVDTESLVCLSLNGPADGTPALNKERDDFDDGLEDEEEDLW